MNGWNGAAEREEREEEEEMSVFGGQAMTPMAGGAGVKTKPLQVKRPKDQGFRPDERAAIRGMCAYIFIGIIKVECNVQCVKGANSCLFLLYTVGSDIIFYVLLYTHMSHVFMCV